VTRFRALLLFTVCALLAAPPARADVQRYYHGTTPQGREITMVGAPDGTPLSVTLGFRVACRRHDYAVRDTIGVQPPEYARSRREFAAVVADTVAGPPRATGTIEIALTGRRVTPRGRPGGEYWQGTLEVEVDVLDPDDGSLRERCRTRRMRWRAWREGFGSGGWTMTSDPGDELGAGRVHSLPELVVRGDARSIFVSAPAADEDDPFGWTAEFHAPPGARLRRGATYVDHGYDSDGDAGLYVSSPSRSCSEGGGSFTVRSVRYDRRGRLRDLALAFTHWCYSPSDPALRGTIAFRSRR